MNTRTTRLAFMAGMLALCSTASAGPHLVGFVIYRADSEGNAVNAPAYFYTSNTQIGASRPILFPESGPSQSTSISIPLVDGDNAITFRGDTSFHPGNQVGVQLYFNDTGDVFNPLTPGIEADLAAFVPTGTSLLTSVAAGRSLIDYGNSFGPSVSYSGATSFTVGDRIISINALTINSTPAGSITINVSPVPAPGAAGLLAIAGLAGVRRRR